MSDYICDSKILKRMNIPKDFYNMNNIQDLDLSNKKVKEQYIKLINAFKNFKENRFNNYIVMGGSLCGKTLWSSFYMKLMYQETGSYNIKRISVKRYLEIYNNYSFKNDDTEIIDDEMGTFIEDNFLLVLDNFGEEDITVRNNCILEDLIKRRIDLKLPTIICTRLPVKGLLEKYGKNFISVIDSKYKVIDLSKYKPKYNELLNNEVVAQYEEDLKKKLDLFEDKKDIVKKDKKREIKSKIDAFKRENKLPEIYDN